MSWWLRAGLNGPANRRDMTSFTMLWQECPCRCPLACVVLHSSSMMFGHIAFAAGCRKGDRRCDALTTSSEPITKRGPGVREIAPEPSSWSHVVGRCFRIAARSYRAPHAYLMPVARQRHTHMKAAHKDRALPRKSKKRRGRRAPDRSGRNQRDMLQRLPAKRSPERPGSSHAESYTHAHT